MAKKSIQTQLITRFGLLILIAFVVVLLLSRFVLQVYITKQLKNDFQQELAIATAVIHAEIVGNQEIDSVRALFENIRIGNRKLGYYNLNSQIEFFTYVNKSMKYILQENGLSKADYSKVQSAIEENRIDEIINMSRESKNKSMEYLVFISPINPNLADKEKANRLYAVMYVSTDSVHQVVGQSTKLLLLILLPVYFVSLIVISLISRNITNPIKALKKYAAEIGSKAQLKPLQLKSHNELLELADTMNIMAKEIKDYDEEQMRFLQNASHELKTPLTSIQGYAEGILDGVVEDQEEALNIIINESIRLKKIVNELSYLSKLETGSKVFKLEPMNVKDCIEDVIRTMTALAASESIEIKLTFEMGCDNVRTLGDYDNLIQSFMNIVSNGIRYAHREITIHLSASNKGVKIQFIDDGNGIKESAIVHLFERFYKGAKGQTGLGLAITKAIIEKHKGTIKAYNSEDKGAVFEIILPVYE